MPNYLPNAAGVPGVRIGSTPIDTEFLKQKYPYMAEQAAPPAEAVAGAVEPQMMGNAENTGMVFDPQNAPAMTPTLQGYEGALQQIEPYLRDPKFLSAIFDRIKTGV